MFLSASQPAYACSTIWTPDPTAVARRRRDPGPRLRPAGHGPPARRPRRQGDLHLLRAGLGQPLQPARRGGGPIPARLYGPNDNVLPQGWIHNLEHGGIVILYRGDSAGATPEGQAQLRALYDAFPNSPVCNVPKGEIAPVIARFDQMSTPFQAIVWGRVLPLETLDDAKILAFYQQWGERTNPEKQCAPVSSPTVTTAPSDGARARPRARAERGPEPVGRPERRAQRDSAAPGASAAPSPS